MPRLFTYPPPTTPTVGSTYVTFAAVAVRAASRLHVLPPPFTYRACTQFTFYPHTTYLPRLRLSTLHYHHVFHHHLPRSLPPHRVVCSPRPRRFALPRATDVAVCTFVCRCLHARARLLPLPLLPTAFTFYVRSALPFWLHLRYTPTVPAFCHLHTYVCVYVVCRVCDYVRVACLIDFRRFAPLPLRFGCVCHHTFALLHVAFAFLHTAFTLRFAVCVLHFILHFGWFVAILLDELPRPRVAGSAGYVTTTFVYVTFLYRAPHFDIFTVRFCLFCARARFVI